MIPEKKENYREEVTELLRQQYKFSPRLSGLLFSFSNKVQEIENALFEVYSYNRNYGVFENTEGFVDPILKMGRTFNVLITQPINLKDIVERVLAQIWVAVSRGTWEDITGLSEFVYGYHSTIHDAKGAILLTVEGDISSDNGRKGKVLFDALTKMMPPTIKITHISESDPNEFFTFSEYGGSGAVGFTDRFIVGDNSFSRIVIDGEGNYIQN